MVKIGCQNKSRVIFQDHIRRKSHAQEKDKFIK